MSSKSKYNLLEINKNLSYLITIIFLISFFGILPSYALYYTIIIAYLNMIWRGYLLCTMKNLEPNMVVHRGMVLIILFLWTLGLIILSIYLL